MELVARLLRSARVLVLGDREVVVLRHSETGALFTDGSSDHAAVYFGSETEAATFSHRFLDEGPAWLAVVVSELCRAA